MELSPFVSQYVNSSESLLSILKQHFNKKDKFESVFIEMLSSDALKNYDTSLVKKVDELIVEGHKDANIYLLFISNAIRFNYSFNQYEKAVSLYSIIASILNDSFHPVIQAACLQAKAQIKIIEGKKSETIEIMTQAIKLINVDCPRHKYIFFNYAKSMATTGLLYSLDDNKLTYLENIGKENLTSYIETILLNCIITGNYTVGFELMEKHKTHLSKIKEPNIYHLNEHLKVYAGNLDEDEYTNQDIKTLLRSFKFLQYCNIDDAIKEYKLTNKSNFIYNQKLEISRYFLIHLHINKNHREMAYKLLDVLKNNEGDHYLDDLFYGRLYILEGNYTLAKKAFNQLNDNVSKYRAMNRLKFELQFVKEMRIEDLFHLYTGSEAVLEGSPKVLKKKRKGDSQISNKGISLLIGNSESINQVKVLAQKYAQTEGAILITGETGTGKELIARAIHDEGFYSNEKFLAVNCGALTDSLLQSELFGYVAGAFTGAQREKKGIFESAGNGTVMLDEFGDISQHLQASLLRVIEYNEIRRIGDTVNRKINCKIVIATNKNLQNAVEKKLFRNDLYFRLIKYEIKIPALRYRKEDLPMLINYFLNIDNNQDTIQKKISIELENALLEYDWPGNVRELKNEIDRMRILTTEKNFYDINDFDFSHLQDTKSIQFYNKSTPTSNTSTTGYSQEVDDPEIERLISKGRKPERQKIFLINLFKKYNQLTRQQVIEVLGVCPATATKELKLLCDKGIIVRREPTKSPRTFYFEYITQ